MTSIPPDGLATASALRHSKMHQPRPEIKDLLALSKAFGYQFTGFSILLVYSSPQIGPLGVRLLHPRHMWLNSGQFWAKQVDVNWGTVDKATV
jgi:hypothetical protein